MIDESYRLVVNSLPQKDTVRTYLIIDSICFVQFLPSLCPEPGSVWIFSLEYYYVYG